MINFSRPTPTKLNIWPVVWLALGYALLALALTWPTAAHLSTHLPGDGGDDPAIAWNLWWVKYALLNAGQNPFQTDFMFYPLGLNLAFYTLTPLNAAAALPFTLNLGVVAASNLHMLFTLIIAGLGAFLLARYLLADQPQPNQWWCAALAGGFYAFAGSKLFYVALGQFNIASAHWIPLAVLYAIRTHRQPRRLKNAILAGLFLTLQAWAELTYASFVLVFVGLYWLYWLLASISALKNPAAAWRAARPQLIAALALLAVFVVGISPILARMLPDMFTEGDFMVEGGGFAAAFSADLLGFVIPTMRHPLLGGLVTHTGIIAFDKGQHIYLGVTLLGLALLAAATGYKNAQTRFWLLAALVFALLTLGPTITINGHATGLAGPFVVLQQLPFFKGNRYPSRYSVMLILSLSVLAGFALAWLTSRTRRAPLLAALVAGLFLAEHLSAPLPQSDMRLPAPYQTIAADPANFAVLDIPFAWRNGFRITGAYTTQFMFGQFYQTAYQKPLLQGNTSRNPEFKFRYFTQAPLLNSLLALETGKTLPPERLPADRAIAADALRFFNLKYIIVRPDFSGSPIVTPQATIPYIEAALPVQKIYADSALTLYQVNAGPPPATLQITTNSPLAPLYFGEGWGVITPGQPVAAQRTAARLLLPLAGGATRLTLNIRAPQPQTVTLAANGWQSAPQPITTAWQPLTFTLPAAAVRVGPNDIWLKFERTAPAPPDITVLSAGEEVGSYGHIYVNGIDVSPNRRGYNVAVITPDGVQTANFDTHADPAAALAQFLRAAPANATIALAAADEAGAQLSDDAAQTIRQVTGATGSLRGCFRCSHAIIRPAGGPPLEALDALRPVAVTTGPGLTEPALAAQVDWLKIEPAAPQGGTP